MTISFSVVNITTPDTPEKITDVKYMLKEECGLILQKLGHKLDVDLIGIYLITMSSQQLIDDFSQKKAGTLKFVDIATKEETLDFTVPIGFENKVLMDLDVENIKILVLNAILEYENNNPRFIKRYSEHLKLLKKVATIALQGSKF